MTCEALERIMALELEASMRRGIAEGKLEGKILAYKDVGMSVETIAEKVSLSVQDHIIILKLSQEF